MPAGDIPTVRVLGQAAVRAQPDEGFVWLTLTALRSSAGEALEDVASRSGAMAALLDELAIDAEDRSTTGVTVAEEFDHTQAGMRSLGHRATATTVVRVNDGGLIGRIITRATTELDARIQGPSWRVSQDHEVWLEAARQAAAQARRKAEAYARGVDAELGSLIAIAEPDEPRFPGKLIPLAARAAAGGPDLHLDTGDQEVTASVWVQYGLRVPARA